MAIEWTGLGPNVLLRLDRDADEPLRFQLERELREAIRSGVLAAAVCFQSASTSLPPNPHLIIGPLRLIMSVVSV